MRERDLLNTVGRRRWFWVGLVFVLVLTALGAAVLQGSRDARVAVAQVADADIAGDTVWTWALPSPTPTPTPLSGMCDCSIGEVATPTPWGGP